MLVAHTSLLHPRHIEASQNTCQCLLAHLPTDGACVWSRRLHVPFAVEAANCDDVSRTAADSWPCGARHHTRRDADKRRVCRDARRHGMRTKAHGLGRNLPSGRYVGASGKDLDQMKWFTIITSHPSSLPADRSMITSMNVGLMPTTMTDPCFRLVVLCINARCCGDE